MSTSDRDERYVTPLGDPDPVEVATFWSRCMAATGIEGELPAVEVFGDTVELADELIALVLEGRKRASAGPTAVFAARGEPIPAPGDLWIATDGARRPRALLQSKQVRVGPMSSVTDQFAWDEGEGDRTRESWLDDHRWDYARQFAAWGMELPADPEVAFERFEVRYTE